MLKTTTKTR